MVDRCFCEDFNVAAPDDGRKVEPLPWKEGDQFGGAPALTVGRGVYGTGADNPIRSLLDTLAYAGANQVGRSAHLSNTSGLKPQALIPPPPARAPSLPPRRGMR